MFLSVPFWIFMLQKSNNDFYFMLFTSAYSSYTVMAFVRTSSYRYIVYFDHVSSITLPPSFVLTHPLLLVHFTPLNSFIFTFMSHVHTLCIYIKSRLHKWKKTYNICLSEPDLIHLLWISSVASIFFQVTQLHFSLWLNRDSIVYMYHIFFYPSSSDKHLGWLHSIAVVNNATANIYLQVSLR